MGAVAQSRFSLNGAGEAKLFVAGFRWSHRTVLVLAFDVFTMLILDIGRVAARTQPDPVI